jgi:sporulation protein YlmC with PRC-barrel domain
MLTRKTILMMTTAAAICAAPVLAFGQQNTGGSSQMQGTTQTTPQQGTDRGMPAARGAATTGSDTGQAPNTGGLAPRASGNPGQQSTSGAEGRTPNPSGNATGESQQTTGGRAAAPGAPGATTQGQPGSPPSQLDRIRQNEGNSTGNDARGGPTAQANPPGAAPGARQPDGTPGNPPSTATQRAADQATGNRTSPDGTGNNPPGTAAGRALNDAATGVGAATGAAAGAVTGAATGASTGSQATGATQPGMAVDSMRLEGGRRASRVIGSTIYNENNETVGEVDDIIVPQPGQQAGGSPVAVISVGGFLGIGARLVAVPYERLQFNAERERWTLQGATKDSLQSLPAFTYSDGNRRG